MRHRAPLALLAVLAALPAGAQEVTATSSTYLQYWRQDNPGSGKATYLPATQFVGVDASKLGLEGLSVHVYGWGRTDLRDQSRFAGQNAADFTYGYAEYRFSRANAAIKAGRFAVTEGIGAQTVDGVQAQTDLRAGFTVSAFGGKPVVYKNLSDHNQNDSSFEQDVIFGGRLGWRAAKFGEIGVSYIQDGSKPAYALDVPLPTDYTRRLLAVDIRLMPCSYIDISGRTVRDVNDRPQPAPGTDPSRLAEHNYRATAQVAKNVSVSGTFVERNFAAYYSGTTLPGLFNPNEPGMFKATGLSATWQAAPALQVVADVKRTTRETRGNSTRAGADVRYTVAALNLQTGAGFHRVNAYSVPALDIQTPAYSLSHDELRAWVMASRGSFSASLDAIHFHFDDGGTNPVLNGKSSQSAVVGSLGYQMKNGLKVSGDLTYQQDPIYKDQTMGLVRVEYRLSPVAKGGK